MLINDKSLIKCFYSVTIVTYLFCFMHINIIIATGHSRYMTFLLYTVKFYAPKKSQLFSKPSIRK